MTTEMTAVPVVPLGPIPCTYVYVARLQGAAQAIAQALEATSDQALNGPAAGAAVERARQWIAGIYALKAEGIES
jgi:hypothetical protein